MEFIDLKSQYQRLKPEIDKRVLQVMEKGKFILADEVREFEEKIAQYVGMKYCVSCGNGTEALQMIYMAYGIGEGDAVFCPDMTFIASIEPAVMLGAHPVFCDIEMSSYNIDPADLEIKIKKTLDEGIYHPKAIVAVDFLGNPVNIDILREIANRYHLLLIEDAAQAMGAEIKGRKCGSLGDVAATSFFPTKPLGCYGDGGAVFTNDESLKEIFLSLRTHGKGISKYDNVRIGLNSRLDTIQAAILLVKLEILEDEVKRRQEIAAYYTDKLKDCLVTPYIEEGSISSYAQYVVLAEDEKQKNELMEELKRNGIPTICYYPNPLHKLPVFEKDEYGVTYCPNTVEYTQRAFAIPFSPYLSQKDQNQVIDVIRKKIKI